jgi:hypothetical protein
LSTRDGFRFLLSVCPKGNINSKNFDWVSELLKLESTEGHQIGDKVPWNKDSHFDQWTWGYGSQWITFEHGKSFSDALHHFLKSLPSDEKIWQKLSKYCEYSLYIPIERKHFHIEVDFEPKIWSELNKRELRLNLSTLSKDIE